MFIIVGMYHKLQDVFTKESRRAGNPEQLACFFIQYTHPHPADRNNPPHQISNPAAV
jgi:hypothetical protein